MADKKIKEHKNEREIPQKKLKAADEIKNAIKNKKTFMICSIQSLPASQFQRIKKQLKQYGEMRVLKKNVLKKALEMSGNEEVKKMEQYLNDNVAVFYSDLDSFVISGILADNKNPIKAKVGQVVDKEIIIEAGPTEIPPGPAISEFGSLGIKVGVENGKIAVKESKTILKPGQKVTDGALALMSKLNIMPFEVGIDPVAAYDKEENKIYFNIKINKKQVLKDLVEMNSKSIAFAYSIGYVCKETLGLLLGKANSEGVALSSLIKTEEKQENTQQNIQEEK